MRNRWKKKAVEETMYRVMKETMTETMMETEKTITNSRERDSRKKFGRKGNCNTGGTQRKKSIIIITIKKMMMREMGKLL